MTSNTYLQSLYMTSQALNTPAFNCYSGQIRIIEDPLQYYTAIIKGIQNSNRRVGLSCLYLGTETLEHYILSSLKSQMQKHSELQAVMVFDYTRSQRREHGQSGVQMLNRFYQGNNPENTHIGFYQTNNWGKGVISEIFGVHHQKMCIFDNDVIIGGANLSRNYFIDRIDRYLKFQDLPELGDYLFDYLMILQKNSHRFIKGQEQPIRNSNNFVEELRLWKNEHSHEKCVESIRYEQEKQNLLQQEKNHQLSVKTEKEKQIIMKRNSGKKLKNTKLTKILGIQADTIKIISNQEKIKRMERVRQNISSEERQDEIDALITEVDFLVSHSSNFTKKGQKVCIFPFLSNNSISEAEYPVFESIVDLAVKNEHSIKISSGYMNFPEDTINRLSRSKEQVQILCSSPEANSFYHAGRIKRYIPHFYRVFQSKVLQASQQTFLIKEFNKPNWTFHTKGVWIKENSHSYITIVGSSNYNARSRERDTELQLYLYSTCPDFNLRLDEEWERQARDCKRIGLKEIYEDQDTTCNWKIKVFAWLLARFL